MAVMEKPVEDGGCGDSVTEHLSPFANGTVRGDKHAAAFVTPADRLEEQMCRVLFEGQVTELIHDQEFRLCKERQPLIEPVFGMGLGELGDKGLRRDEQNRVTSQDGGPADRDGKVGPANPRRPEQKQGFAIGNEAAGRQLLDLRFVDRGPGGKIEACEIACKGKAGKPYAHFDAPPVFARNLAFKKKRERLADGQLAAGSFVDKGIELIAVSFKRVSMAAR